MKIQKHKEIYWGELRGASISKTRKDFTYLYGSTIIFHSLDQVYFENKLMASGQTIHEWSSSWNYQGDRQVPSLPLIKRGRPYSLTRDMTSYPSESVFLKLIFFDRYNKKVGNIVERSDKMAFTYPKEAYSYKVQLLSAGVESFEFHCLRIEEILEESNG